MTVWASQAVTTVIRYGPAGNVPHQELGTCQQMWTFSTGMGYRQPSLTVISKNHAHNWTLECDGLPVTKGDRRHPLLDCDFMHKQRQTQKFNKKGNLDSASNMKVMRHIIEIDKKTWVTAYKHYFLYKLEGQSKSQFCKYFFKKIQNQIESGMDGSDTTC